MKAAVLHAIGEPLRVEEGSRNDLAEVIALAQEGKLTATTESHRLDDVNKVLQRLEHGLIQGRAVVVP